MRLFITKKNITSLNFMEFSDENFLKFMLLNDVSPNDYWAEDNPLLHVLLANEYFSYFSRFLTLTPERINPNLCDGKYFGNKSLLIILTLMVSNEALVHQFIDLYKGKINFDYQDSHGKTALHYAIILGRVDLVKHLTESGASLDVHDDDGLYPYDYVNCSDDIIIETLQKIDINPWRDINASRNNLRDHHERPLILQGDSMLQNKEILARVIKSSMVLCSYIAGRDEDWGACTGDNLDITDDEIKHRARSIAQNFNVPFSQVFEKKELSGFEQQQFREHLRQLHQQFTGTLVLERCLAGHNQIQNHLNSSIVYLPIDSGL